MVSVIDEYREDLPDQTSGKDVIQAIQSEFLEEAPKVLFLQLNRLDFKDNQPFKHLHKVNIKKQILLDRFMHQNREKNKKIREQV
jgi:hypothetical protein|tara:strand:+ start:289 stop:543 length:255 start_codon:yes stop_codon:yes gene_type:complete